MSRKIVRKTAFTLALALAACMLPMSRAAAQSTTSSGSSSTASSSSGGSGSNVVTGTDPEPDVVTGTDPEPDYVGIILDLLGLA